MHLNKLAEGLPGEPGFCLKRILDKGALTGRQNRRTIKAPNEAMRALHKGLRRWLNRLNISLPYATGYDKKCSPRKNVLRHRQNRYFYLLDIHRAFSFVDGKKLADVLCRCDRRLTNQEAAVLDFLKKYCLNQHGGLATGFNASPALFNLYAGILIDRPLGELCEKWGLIYTRYGDDLTFSSPLPIGKKKRLLIRSIIQQAGFLISFRKAQLLDLAKGPANINGIGLELGGRLFVPRHFVRRARGFFHNATYKKPITPKSCSSAEGFIGAFFNVTGNTSALNATEKKLVSGYQDFKKLTKRQTA